MLLHLPEPSLFSCEPDEAHFFAWLKEIPAVVSVTGTPKGLDVTFDTPIDRVSFYELVGLFIRYGLDSTTLRPLCEGHEDSWFNDEGNYWHSAVYAASDERRPAKAPP